MTNHEVHGQTPGAIEQVLAELAPFEAASDRYDDYNFAHYVLSSELTDEAFDHQFIEARQDMFIGIAAQSEARLMDDVKTQEVTVAQKLGLQSSESLPQVCAVAHSALENTDDTNGALVPDYSNRSISGFLEGVVSLASITGDTYKVDVQEVEFEVGPDLNIDQAKERLVKVAKKNNIIYRYASYNAQNPDNKIDFTELKSIIDEHTVEE